jgi:hypothetical protein
MTHAVAAMFRTVRCTSPVCTAWINVRTTYTLATALRLRGWRLEQQHGDLEPSAYCPRCRQ